MQLPVIFVSSSSRLFHRRANDKPSKKRKLFDFMSDTTLHQPTYTSLLLENMCLKRTMLLLQWTSSVFWTESSADWMYLMILSEPQLFYAPCIVLLPATQFSVIIRSTRSRIFKSRLAQLVFLKCNRHLPYIDKLTVQNCLRIHLSRFEGLYVLLTSLPFDTRLAMSQTAERRPAKSI